MNDELITGKILKIHGWPDGRLIGLAKQAAATLSWPPPP